MGCRSNLYDARVPGYGDDYCLYDLAHWKNGLAFSKIDFSQYGKPIIKIAELNHGLTDNTAYTNGTYSSEVHVTHGDLLFSWSGNPDTSIDIYRYNLPDGWLNQHIFKVTPNEEVVSKEYFYFLMKQLKPIFKAIASNKQTTGLGHVTVADLQRIRVTIPPRHVQVKQVRLLSKLDAKITLNLRINGYLAA